MTGVWQQPPWVQPQVGMSPRTAPDVSNSHPSNCCGNEKRPTTFSFRVTIQTAFEFRRCRNRLSLSLCLSVCVCLFSVCLSPSLSLLLRPGQQIIIMYGAVTELRQQYRAYTWWILWMLCISSSSLHWVCNYNCGRLRLTAVLRFTNGAGEEEKNMEAY